MASEKKFAVLVDADNVSDKYIKVILDEISKDGIATYKRIYGDWTKPTLASWKTVLLDNSILPIQQYNYTTGKNSTDSAMIIDAMDILYSGQVDGFCIVSSDSDFTRLAARLRESGMTVVGMGEKKTPKSFISACNMFKYLDILTAAERKAEDVRKQAERRAQEKQKEQKEQNAPQKAAQKAAQSAPKEEAPKPCGPAETPKPEGSEPQTDIETIKEAIKLIVADNSDEDDWMFIGTIGNLLVKRYPDFDVRNFGYPKLTLFIKSLGLFEIKSVRTGENGSHLIYIKLK
ncbi:MAG: NYN domain-containing protein [Clostridiaceae bacterium]|nr:NYN domain-containing protein [Eubacteriales bacterium]